MSRANYLVGISPLAIYDTSQWYLRKLLQSLWQTTNIENITCFQILLRSSLIPAASNRRFSGYRFVIFRSLVSIVKKQKRDKPGAIALVPSTPNSNISYLYLLPKHNCRSFRYHVMSTMYSCKMFRRNYDLAYGSQSCIRTSHTCMYITGIHRRVLLRDAKN